MLEAIRVAAQTTAAKIILTLITIPFAFWGVESYIRGNPSADAVATVEGNKITQQEFTNAQRNQLERFRQQFGGNIDQSIMETPEMRKNILDQMIDQRLVSTVTKSSGLMVSDAALVEKLKSEASLQDGGKFSATRYENFLKNQGLSATNFENMLRQDLERSQFTESVVNTSIVGKKSVQQYLEATEQQREIAVVNLTLDQYMAKVAITPERVKTYYEEKKVEFTIPEQVKLEYLEVSVDAVASQTQLTAEEIQKAYEGKKDSYTTKEERKASHILISVTPKSSDADKATAKAKADALYAEVKKAPAKFAELAKANSQDPGSGASGGDLGFFGRGSMVKPFEEAVFGAAVGDIMPPVLSDFGYHIITLTGLKPQKVKTLAEATPEIEGELKKSKAQAAFASAAEKFKDLVFEKPSSLKDAADAVKLTPRQTQFFSKAAATPPFNNPKVIAAVFTDDVLKNKRNSEAVEFSPGNLISARLLESKPAIVRPFEEVQKIIADRLQREEAVKLAKADGEAKLKALREGKTAEVTFPAVLAVSRNNPAGLPPSVITEAMRANSKALPAYVGVDNPGAGYSLVLVSKVIPPAAPDEAKAKSQRDRFAQSISQQELASTLLAVRAKSDVSVNKGALDKKPDAPEVK
jgi:peptidyl-prolyl cis-trans isomerase D